MSSDGISAITRAVVSAVLKIVLLVSVGMKLELQGMLDGPKRKCLSAIAMDVCLPCLMFSRVLPESDLELLAQGWQLLLWPFVYPVVGALLGALCCAAVGAPRHLLLSAAICAAFPNVNGFPVAVVSALGPALPPSPQGFSALVFLSLLQLTDGIVKYTVGPAAFRHQVSVLMKHSSDGSAELDELPLGLSVRSIDGLADRDRELVPLQNSTASMPRRTRTRSTHSVSYVHTLRAVRTERRTRTAVEPEFSRFESYNFFIPPSGMHTSPTSTDYAGGAEVEATGSHQKTETADYSCWENTQDMLRQLLPPQVVAVIIALVLGARPSWKELFISSDPESLAPLGFIHGVTMQLGGGFVPMQMIALGGRLVNVASASGPLRSGGAAGPRGRHRLLRMAGAVGVARMVLTPLALYGIALALDSGCRCCSMAFWAPALIVGAMPTANNISTMADLAGAGRSISAATTAMQLLASPVLLAVSLTLLVAGIQYQLASDFE